MENLKALENGHWQLDNFTIRHGHRWDKGAKPAPEIKAKGRDIYHVYLDGSYIGRGATLEDAVTFIKHYKKV